ncbi:VOC family protein [uncultured Shewanella sp.]|uniref:VOC family protein n=1 Tax=uncultured Shewanella sp. TaxID=173975 RepID=UPI00260C3BBC|nr:VOC family protein [uncultured Shewanella sp.]
MNTMTSPLSFSNLLHSWPSFCKKIQSFMNELDISTYPFECDHVAIRINQLTDALQLKNNVHEFGDIISENIINGRPILIIKLHHSLHLGALTIDYLELPFPSEKRYPEQGWEHIELIFPSNAIDCQTLSDELLLAIPKLAPIIANQTSIKVKMSSPRGDKERLPNPTIAFKKHNICIKIHPHHIKTIIASEHK